MLNLVYGLNLEEDTIELRNIKLKDFTYFSLGKPKQAAVADNQFDFLNILKGSTVTSVCCIQDYGMVPGWSGYRPARPWQ